MDVRHVSRNSGKKSGSSKRKRGIRGTVYSDQSPYTGQVKREGASLLLLLSAIIGIVLACLLWKGGTWVYEQFQKEKRYDRIIVKAAVRNGIDPCLLKAVIWKESRFEVDSIGSKGEIGLMQVMPQAAVKDWEKAYGNKIPSNAVLMDPNLNIEIGSWYLAQCLSHWKEFKDCTILALCEYNAGIQRASKWRPLLPDQPMFDAIDIASTRRYVQEITQKQKEYSEKWNWLQYK